MYVVGVNNFLCFPADIICDLIIFPLFGISRFLRFVGWLVVITVFPLVGWLFGNLFVRLTPLLLVCGVCVCVCVCGCCCLGLSG